MKRIVLAALMAAILLPSVGAAAQVTDRITFGNDVSVEAGEVVNDVVTMGGDAHIEGEVRGDVVTMGGDLDVTDSGHVLGEAVTMGGDVTVDDSGRIEGRVQTFGGEARGDGIASTPTSPVPPQVNVDLGPGHSAHDGWSFGEWVVDTVQSFVSHVLLFILGLLLMGVAKERYEALQVTIVKKPLPSFGYGLLGIVGAIVAIVVLAITIIGIPAAVLGAIALPIAIYVGLAAFAAVFGAALPVEQLRGKPVLQLAAGVGTLWLVSLIPFMGAFATAVAAALGLGALFITRFRTTAQLPPDPTPSGPYRTSTV
jgi:hypothetical protein